LYIIKIIIKYNFLQIRKQLMADYIYCTKKSNKPRIDVRVCQTRCPDREFCRDLADYLKAHRPVFISAADQAPIRDAAITR